MTRMQREPGTSRVRVRLASVGLVCVVLGLSMAGYGPAGAIIAGFLVLTPLERLMIRHRQRVLRPGIATDVFHVLITSVLQTAGTFAGAVIGYLAVRPFRSSTLQRVVVALPAPIWFLVTFVVANVAFYWHHRLSHRWPTLWRFHAVHHSSERLDWLAGARLHPVEGLTAGLMVAPFFGIVDVRPLTVGAITAALNMWGIVLHANVGWRLRWLDRFLVTPEYHHWHHDRRATDRNFAGVLPVIDSVFGTRHDPNGDRPETYGTDTPVPARWWDQMRWPFRSARGSGN